MRLIEQEAGNALDPRVVEAFLRSCRASQARSGERRQASAQMRARSMPRPHRPTRTDRSKSSVFNDIAIAHGEIYALYQIAQTMGTSLGVSDTMALIASKLTNLVPFSACTLFLYDESQNLLSCRFATGHRLRADAAAHAERWSGHHRAGWHATGVRSSMPARAAISRPGARRLPTTLQSALVCPLLLGDRVIGTLAVYHTTPSFYGDDHRRLLDRVCEQAAAVIHNAIVFEQTHEASLTDPLTTCRTRDSWSTTLDASSLVPSAATRKCRSS